MDLDALRPRVGQDEVVQVVVHGALYPALADWLARQGFYLVELESEPDDVRTFGIGLGEHRTALLRRQDEHD